MDPFGAGIDLLDQRIGIGAAQLGQLPPIKHPARQVMTLCVRQSKMDRKTFLQSFAGNEANLKWLPKQVKAGHTKLKAVEAAKKKYEASGSMADYQQYLKLRKS